MHVVVVIIEATENKIFSKLGKKYFDQITLKYLPSSQADTRLI